MHARIRVARRPARAKDARDMRKLEDRLFDRFCARGEPVRVRIR
jgi:hypothetical protein